MAIDGPCLMGGHNNQLNLVSAVGGTSVKARDRGGTYGGLFWLRLGR